MDVKKIQKFRRVVMQHYRRCGRRFPWRTIRNPYHVFISEVMLQQTQTDRVVQKYLAFVRAFKTFRALARAPLKKILRVWHGLGYNRRALYVKQAAEKVVEQYHGRLPHDQKLLDALPGIGSATAASIAAFAWNEPTVFIETNIRSALLHFFFENKKKIPDRKILPLVAATLDRRRPREWYYALMDYGAMLKRQYPNPSRRSAHYKKQTPFKDSQRELRGKILRLCLAHPCTARTIARKIKTTDKKIKPLLLELEKEGLLVRTATAFVVP